MTSAVYDTEVSMRRGKRRPTTPVDVHRFHSEIDKAMDAFREDVSYAVLMARAAVTITRKRGVWQARRDARAQAG